MKKSVEITCFIFIKLGKIGGGVMNFVNGLKKKHIY